MKILIIFLNVLFFTIVLTNCAVNSDPFGTDTNSNISAVTDSGITTVDSIADDLVTGIGIASIDDMGVGDPNLVTVDSCSGTWSGCSSGVKTRNLSCTDGSISYTKDITLNFNTTPSCSFSTSGDYFIRTQTSTISGPNGGTYVSTSDASNNYLGTSVGGGSKITYETSEYDIDILGINKKLSKSTGTAVWNHSIRTTSGKPFIINHFKRDGRVISSGELVVDHNIAGFTATMDFNSVTYQRGCCYPTAGTITMTLTGSITGVRTITFNQCGFANITNIDGTFITAQLFGCENSATGDDAVL